MTTKIKLSKIEKIPLPNCWDYEASDFTEELIFSQRPAADGVAGCCSIAI